MHDSVPGARPINSYRTVMAYSLRRQKGGPF